MAIAALDALYEAVKIRLTENSEVWGLRVYPDLAEAETQRPYVVFSYAGGGELNARVGQDAEIVLTIKGITPEIAQAFLMAGRISSLFNDATNSTLNMGAEWTLINSKQELIVHLVETVDGVQIYHAGHRFRFRMERV